MGPTSLPVGRFGADATDFDHFVAICTAGTDVDQLSHADRVESGIPIYDGDQLRAQIAQGDVAGVIDELGWCLGNGPGVVAIDGAYGDSAAVDAMTDIFHEIVEAERDAGGGGDHFAAAGANTRVWNVFQKSAERAPDVFVQYYRNPILAVVTEAWLGPHFQLTAQVNIVHPGGAAQNPHRDYHLGFQGVDEASRFPRHAHIASQLLTLQGAVAHSDMPLETGPTMYLPNSQRFLGGYIGYQDQRFVDYFAQHHVQLPLAKGDAVFFNPALHHGAGHNRTTSVERIANLLQINSAMGKPLEAVDTYAIAAAVYPTLLAQHRNGDLDGAELDAAIIASADGYSFPTNLDTDPPLGGMVPVTGQGLVRHALAESWSPERLRTELSAQQAKRRP